MTIHRNCKRRKRLVYISSHQPINNMEIASRILLLLGHLVTLPKIYRLWFSRIQVNTHNGNGLSILTIELSVIDSFSLISFFNAPDAGAMTISKKNWIVRVCHQLNRQLTKRTNGVVGQVIT